MHYTFRKLIHQQKNEDESRQAKLKSYALVGCWDMAKVRWFHEK
jgi:hypothetical protein